MPSLETKIFFPLMQVYTRGYSLSHFVQAHRNRIQGDTA